LERGSHPIVLQELFYNQIAFGIQLVKFLSTSPIAEEQLGKLPPDLPRRIGTGTLQGGQVPAPQYCGGIHKRNFPLKKYVSPFQILMLPIFSLLIFFPKNLEFNFFSNNNFQKPVTVCFVHKNSQKTLFITKFNEYFCYSFVRFLC
jgi:hypothetical protein